MACLHCHTTAPRSTRNEYLIRTNGLHNDDYDDVIPDKILKEYLVENGCDKEIISILFSHGVHSMDDLFYLKEVNIDKKFQGCTHQQKMKIKDIFVKYYQENLEECLLQIFISYTHLTCFALVLNMLHFDIFHRIFMFWC